MWCWWPICYIGDMEFNLVPNTMNFFPSLNRSWGSDIRHQHHNTPECDVGDRFLMLVPSSWCWWRDLSPTSKTCHQPIWSPTSVTNIDVTPLIWFIIDELEIPKFDFLTLCLLNNWFIVTAKWQNQICFSRFHGKNVCFTLYVVI